MAVAALCFLSWSTAVAQAPDAGAARAALNARVEAARGAGDVRGEAIALGELGTLEARTGDASAAEARFRESLSAAQRAGDSALYAQSAYNIAVVRTLAGGPGEEQAWGATVGLRGVSVRPTPPDATGRADYLAAAEAANRAGLNVLAARSYAQAARAAPTAALIADARRVLAGAPRSPARIEAALSVADAAIHVHDAGGAGALDTAAALLVEAVADADALREPLLEGYGRGLMARVEARRARPEQALALTRQARFLTESGAARAPGFVWSAQEAALLAQRGETDAALAAYARAAAEIEANRAALAASAPLPGQSSYRAAAEPILAAYADLLLQSARGETTQARLHQARALMEQVKTLQLDQYFQDECITQLVGQNVALEDLPANVAVIYPMLLGDRVEILVSTSRGAITRAPAPAARAAVEADARLLRAALRTDRGDAWRGPAQRLHAALIAPILPALEGANVDTLVFAPDGVLRGVPLAALHDGRQFLVERFAIANALNLALVDPRPLDTLTRRTLIAGVSEARSGMEALPGVVTEVNEVRGLAPGAAMLDAEFTQARFASAVATGRYTIAHLATHASFGASASESFVLAHDRRMSLGDVESIMSAARVRGAPIELLVLSACETAAGDDNAVLGIAGVAYRAGARAVMASLWAIPDEATAELMPAFYGALMNDSATKAQALRAAQMALIRDPATAHPYNWSAFILIGNWL